MAVAASAPLTDHDSYWHVLMGRDIVTHHRFTGNPDWVYGPHHPWVTTQWLSEVLFAGLQALFGWPGLTYLTGVAGAVILVLLVRNIRSAIGGSLTATPIAWVVFGLVGSTVTFDLQERPATLSFIFLAVLARWAWTALTSGQWPRWWMLTGFTWLWAQIHGYWVLVAVTITLVTALRALEQRSLRGWCRPAVLAGLTTLIGAVTPAGWYGVYAPITFHAAASSYLSEWQPTSITGDYAVPFLFVLVLLTATAWARHTTPVPIAHIGWVLAWTVFAVMAFRNVTPAAILITPAAAVATTSTWPRFGTAMRASNLTRIVLAVTVTVAAIAYVARLATGEPHRDDTPTKIYAAIAAEPGTRHVLNYYDLGGQTLVFTRPGVQVAIDGRSDMYGQQYLGPFMRLHRLQPGWQDTFETYDPTDVITRDTYPLGQMMPTLGWHPTVSEHGWTLWAKNTEPDPTGSTPTPVPSDADPAR